MTLDQLLEQFEKEFEIDLDRDLTWPEIRNDIKDWLRAHISEMVVEAVGDKQPLLPPPTTPDYGMHSTRTEDNELIRCENNLRAEILQKLGIKV